MNHKIIDAMSFNALQIRNLLTIVILTGLSLTFWTFDVFAQKTVTQDLQTEEGKQFSYPPKQAISGEPQAEVKFQKSSNSEIATVGEAGTNDVVIKTIKTGKVTITFKKSFDQWQTWKTYILNLTVLPQKAKGNIGPKKANPPDTDPANDPPVNPKGGGNKEPNGKIENPNINKPLNGPSKAGTIDPCLVGLWKSEAITPGKNGTVYDSGGNGVYLSIFADGTQTIDFSYMTPLVKVYDYETGPITDIHTFSGQAKVQFSTNDNTAKVEKIIQSDVTVKQQRGGEKEVIHKSSTGGFALGNSPIDRKYTCTQETLTFQGFPMFTANFKRIHGEDGLPLPPKPKKP